MTSRTIKRLGAVTIVVALVGALLVGVLAGFDRPSLSRGKAPERAPADHMIIVGIAGLRWSDVNAHDMPVLTRLLRHGSAGTLSVRAAPDITCPAEGWLTLGAGTYAALTDPRGVNEDAGCQPRAVPPVAESGPPVPTMPQIREVNDDLRFGAKPGVLGDRLPCTTAIGPGAALAVADSNGYLDEYHASLPSDAEKALRTCPLTAIDGGTVDDSGDRRSHAREADALIAQVNRDRPRRSIVAVAGISETQANQARLHVAVLNGPGFSHGWLHSPSTRRIPYVQLVDFAPTALEILGEDVPESLAGRPLNGAAAGRPPTVKATIAMLTDADTQAVAQRSVIGVFFAGFGAALLAVVLAVLLLVWRRRYEAPVPAAVLRWVSIAALALSAVPGATFFANVVPWWRASSPIAAVTAMVVVTSLSMVALALTIGAWSRNWSRRMSVRISVVASITLGIFIVDGMTGAWLQLNSIIGYSPLVAGRFVGFGNPGFAVYATVSVLLASFVAYGYRRAVTLALLAAVAIPVIAFDGLPQWGADFGGVLTLVPTFVVLGLLLTRMKVTWGKVTLATLSGLVLVLAIGYLDYLRPASSRSHFGRFIASIMDGTALYTIRRKLWANIDLLFLGPHTIAAALGVIVGIVVILRPPMALRRTYETWPIVRFALIGSVILAGFGFATNDSGVAIPITMSLILVPTIVALCLWALVGDPWNLPPAAPDPVPVFNPLPDLTPRTSAELADDTAERSRGDTAGHGKATTAGQR